MISIYSERSVQNGLVRRRYKITLTDNLSGSHTQIIGPVTHPVDNDGSEVESDLLSSKKHQEVELYKNDISNGKNPFAERTALWNTRAELLKPILDDAMSKPATDSIVYNGLPYLSQVTDEELKILYGQNQAWVDNVRTEASALLNSKSGFDSYTPILGGGI